MIFDDHQVWASIEALRKRATDTARPGIDGAEAVVEYLIGVLDLALSYRASTPAIMVTPQQLDTVDGAVAAAASIYGGWIGGQYTNEQVDTQAQAIVQSLAPMPKLNEEQYQVSLESTAQTLAIASMTALERFGERRNEVDGEVTTVLTQLETIQQQINQEKESLTLLQTTFENDTADQLRVAREELAKAKADATEALKSDREQQGKEAETALPKLRNFDVEAAILSIV